jgi:hypothetical protein
MASTPLVLRSYRQSVLAKAGGAVGRHAPAVGSWLARAGRRLRTAAFQVAGFGAITLAAWEVARPLGLLTGGVALLVLEPLTGPDPDERS